MGNGRSWVEQKQIKSAWSRYWNEYSSTLWRLWPRSADLGKFVALSMESIAALHTKSNVLASRKLSEGERASLSLPFQKEALESVADILGRPRSEFLEEIVWVKWSSSFRSWLGILPLLSQNASGLGIPHGEEPCWAWVLAASAANTDMPLVLVLDERLHRDFCARITVDCSDVLGLSGSEIAAWQRGPTAVTGNEVDRILNRAGHHWYPRGHL